MAQAIEESISTTLSDNTNSSTKRFFSFLFTLNWIQEGDCQRAVFRGQFQDQHLYLAKTDATVCKYLFKYP